MQPLDPNGQPVTGLTWSSSDTTVVSLSTDDPPVIAAVAVGHATVTAGNASVDITVYPGPFLPMGTIQWSNPGDGSGVYSIVPAVPSSEGVADVFAFQNSGAVQAITSGGKVAWAANAYHTAIPDFQGGLVLASSTSIQKLDGITGQPYPAYSLSHPSVQDASLVIHTDGTIFAVDGDSLVGIDPKTGTAKFTVPMEHTISTINVSAPDTPPAVGNPIVAGDGYAYVAYVYGKSQGNETSTSQIIHEELNLAVLRVGPKGDSSKIPVKQWTSDIASVSVLSHVAYGLYWCDDVCHQYSDPLAYTDAPWKGCYYGPFSCWGTSLHVLTSMAATRTRL